MNDIPTVINSRKFDGSIHRTWTANLVHSDEALLLFKGVFEDSFTHPILGDIHKGMISYEYYWLDRWYNVFRFHEQDGGFRNFYCNVNMPPDFNGKELNYVDLDLDILVRRDSSVEILDEDEYRQNLARYSYPEHVSLKAEEQIAALREMIETRSFPFSETDLL